MTTKAEVKLAIRRLNVWLAKFTRNTFFEHLPVDLLKAAVKDHGFDPEELNGIYCGQQGCHHCHIGSGRYLRFTWYKRETTDRFEVVAYAN